MKRTVLIAYQVLTGLSDTGTGVLLVVAPAFTLRLMQLRVAAPALPFLSYIGAFVLSVGLACLYGGLLAAKRRSEGLETVWLLTGITRALVAVFVAVRIASGALEPGWSTVALTDGAFSLLQCIALARGWGRNVED